MFHTLLRRRTIDATSRRYPMVCVIEPVESRRMLAAAPLDAVLYDPEPPIVGTEGARYVRRVGEDLALWATPDGSGGPYAVLPLPLELTVGGTEGDDVVTIDLAGGDVIVTGLTILASNGDDRVRLANGDGRLLTIDGLPELNGKKLDLGVADLMIKGVSPAAVEPMVASARNAGAVRWQGPGIGTTTATPITGLAPLQEGADVLVKYTYNGDVNGDGRVNADDYFKIDQCFLGGDFCLHQLYREGDLTFDDRYNADDYFQIDLAFLGQGERLGAAAAAPTVAAAAFDDDAPHAYRYLKRVGDKLHAWATPDGSGAPVAVHSLPLAGGPAIDKTASDDEILGVLGLADDGGGGGDDVIRVMDGGGRVLTVGGVELNRKELNLGTAELRVRDGDVVAVEGVVRTARDGATRWRGPGIGTSSAGTRTGLAPRRRGSDVIVKYTYNGDMNGDGRLNADDYFRIDANFLSQPSKALYEQGDLNFDDRVSADDYWILDQAFVGPFFDPWPQL